MENYSSSKIEQVQWLPIYTKIKHQNTYKFMYSDIDNYVNKITSMLSKNYKFQANIMKKSEHSRIIYDLKANFMRVVSDLNMLDLPNLAMCIQYVVQKLAECLKQVFTGFLNCLNSFKDFELTNTNKNLPSELCFNCLTNIQRKNVDSMMVGMTICGVKPSIRQLKALNNLISNDASNLEDIELSLMIDQILQGKDAIFNMKKHQVSSVYDQIAQYLQSIPQSIMNMSRETTIHDKTELAQVSNIADELQNVLNNIVQKPIRKLMKRVLEYAKLKYKPGKQADFSSQTPFSIDEDRFKAMQKQLNILKTEIEKVRTLKRLSQKQMIQMIDIQKRTQIKYSQLNSKHIYLENNYSNTKSELEKTKQRLSLCEINKRTMGDKLIDDYTQQKSILLKTIKTLEIDLKNAESELKRLKKESQDQMVSVGFTTDLYFILTQAETQTQQEIFYDRSNSNQLKGRSKKNSLMKFSSNIRSQLQKFNNDTVIQNFQETDPLLFAEMQDQNQNNSQNRIKIINQYQHKFRTHKKSKTKENVVRNYDSYEENQKNKNQETLTKLRQSRRQKVRSRNAQEFCGEDTDNNVQRTGMSIRSYRRNNGSSQASKREDYNDEVMKSKENMNNYNRQISREKHKTNLLEVASKRCFLSQRHDRPLFTQGLIQGFDKTWSNFDQNYLLSLGTKINGNNEINSSEKICLIQKILQNYELLKNSGLIDKIANIIECNQEDSVSQQQDDVSQKYRRKPIHNHRQMKSCVILDKLGDSQKILGNKKFLQVKQPLSSKKYPRKNQGKTQRIQLKHTARVKQPIENLQTQNYNSIPLTYFTQQQIYLLFSSSDYAAKYQKSEDIWGVLNGSIMVDYNNTLICNKIYEFFKNMKEKNNKFYEQCCQMLNFPSTYITMLKDKDKIFQKNLKTKVGNVIDIKQNKDLKKLLVNKGNCLLSANKKKVSEDDPQKLRNIFQKLIRFHQLIHRKCQHIQEFLHEVGLQIK